MIAVLQPTDIHLCYYLHSVICGHTEPTHCYNMNMYKPLHWLFKLIKGTAQLYFKFIKCDGLTHHKIQYSCAVPFTSDSYILQQLNWWIVVYASKCIQQRSRTVGNRTAFKPSNHHYANTTLIQTSTLLCLSLNSFVHSTLNIGPFVPQVSQVFRAFDTGH